MTEMWLCQQMMRLLHVKESFNDNKNYKETGIYNQKETATISGTYKGRWLGEFSIHRTCWKQERQGETASNLLNKFE